MGATFDMFKTIFVPALISLSIYLLFGYLIVPFFRRYRQRYAQYLPLDTISAHTLPLRERVADAVMHFFLPSSWRLRRRFVRLYGGWGGDDGGTGDENNNSDNNARNNGANGHHRDSSSDSISIFDEEGENMADMNTMSFARREALEARRSTSDTQVRLGRDLEEGFMDDSEEDEEAHTGRGR